MYSPQGYIVIFSTCCWCFLFSLLYIYCTIYRLFFCEEFVDLINGNFESISIIRSYHHLYSPIGLFTLYPNRTRGILDADGCDGPTGCVIGIPTAFDRTHICFSFSADIPHNFTLNFPPSTPYRMIFRPDIATLWPLSFIEEHTHADTRPYNDHISGGGGRGRGSYVG